MAAILLRPQCECPSSWKMRTSSHYSDVIMDTMASQITSLAIVYSTVYSGAVQRNHQSSSSLAFVRGIHRWPGNSLHKWPVTRKMLPFDDAIKKAQDINIHGIFPVIPEFRFHYQKSFILLDFNPLRWGHMSVIASLITGNEKFCSKAVYTNNKLGKPQISAVLAFCDDNSSATGGFPSQRTSYAKTFPWRDFLFILCEFSFVTADTDAWW